MGFRALVLGVCALGALSLSVPVTPARATGPLETSIWMPVLADRSSDLGLALSRIRGAGARYVHVGLVWAAVAPARPASPASPADPAYRWADFDRLVRAARAHGLEPIVMVIAPPAWATGQRRPGDQKVPGDAHVRPDPVAFGRFAEAAARRYNGRFAGLPRVRYWQAWGEPNVNAQLAPQFSRGRPASPGIYLALLTRFAAGVRAAGRDNVVIGGGLSPFTRRADRFGAAMGPLRFMRELLCLSKGSRPRSTCARKVPFDIWAHHPYTSGGPTHHANHPDDVSLGDLPEMRAVLDAAVRLGKVSGRRPVRFWVTEFSWDTQPPDTVRLTVPIWLHGRWVAEGLYRMWRAGVSLVTWYQLRDEPFPESPFQGGLYFRGGAALSRDQPKPALVAFRFPFVAFRTRGAVDVWGRTPTSRAASVVIEESSGGAWRRRAVLRANRHGVFAARLRAGARSLSNGRRKPSFVERVRAAGAYQRAVLADAPSSYWRLGETRGSTARDERGARTGTYKGGIRLGSPGALLGDRNRAVTFDGRNDRVALGRIGVLDTVELWVKTEAIRTNPAFSNRNENHHYQFLGTIGSGNGLAFDTVSLRGAKWVTDGRWHHLVYTYERGVGNLYVDGTLDSTGSWTRLVGGTTATLGYDPSLKGHFRGSIDEVAIYDRPLSAAQVKKHFAASGRSASALNRFQVLGRGTNLRARLAGGATMSLPFSLVRPPDRFVNAFGGGG